MAVALLSGLQVEARRMISSTRLAKLRASEQAVKEVAVDPQVEFLSQMRATIKAGRFQRANRSLEQMQREADEFLQQQSHAFPSIGFAVSVVYQDKMVFSKGYGAATWQAPESHVDGDTIFQIGSISVFVRERIWNPLGMTRTFASMKEAGSSATNVASAHFVCGSQVKGPFDLASAKADVSPGFADGNLAAGSIVSSVTDLATFGRLLLGDGTVDGVTILKNSEILDQMTTGKEEFNAIFKIMYATSGLFSSSRRGVSVGPGYGFDASGQLLWDRAYFDKGGDTFCHQTRNGYLPEDEIGVVVVRNAQGSNTMRTDSVRSYIAGIFLDIPKQFLDIAFSTGATFYSKMTTMGLSSIPDSEKCGPEFIDPSITTAVPDAASWIGNYKAKVNPDFDGSLTLSLAGNGDLELQFGMAVGVLRVLDNQLSPTMGNETQHRVLFDTTVSLSSVGYLGVVDGTRTVEYNSIIFVQV